MTPSGAATGSLRAARPLGLKGAAYPTTLLAIEAGCHLGRTVVRPRPAGEGSCQKQLVRIELGETSR